MKKLTKTLSLVLVVAMVLGLCVIGAGASYSSFTDKDKITKDYTEAVEVMTDLGCVAGNSATTFNPTGTFTRAMAAVILTRLTLGSTTDTLAPSSVTFKDVPATFWGYKYIEYAAKSGYVAGTGNGKYDPNATLTGYQWAAMLLKVLGISASTASTDWQINTAKAYYGSDKFSDVAINATAITREAATQMAYDALFKAKTASSYVYVVGNRTFTTIAEATAYKAAFGGTIVEKAVANDALAYTVFGVTKNAGSDEFGRPSNIYSTATTAEATTYGWDSSNIAEAKTFANKAVATFTTPVTYSAVYNALGCTAASQSVTWYIDGYQDNVGTALTVTKSNTTNTIGGYGITTQLYKMTTSGVTTYRAVQVANYLAKVTKVTAAKDATATAAAVKASVNLTVYDTDYATLTDQVFNTTGLVKGDYVVVNLLNNHATGTITVVSAVKATPVEGVQTSHSATYGNIVVGGNTYYFGNKYGVNTTASTPYIALNNFDYKSTYTFYTDANSAVLGAAIKTAGVSTDYAYVVKTAYSAANGALIGASTNAAKAEVIFTDGTHSVVDLPITQSGSTYTVAQLNADGTVTDAQTLASTLSVNSVGNWFAYVKNTDGTYSFQQVSNVYAAVANGATLNAKTTTMLGTKYTTSATVVTAIDANYAKTSFTGFPTSATTLTGKVLYTYAKDSTAVANVYAVGQAVAAATQTYCYAIKEGQSNAYGTYWTFAVDGKQVEYLIANGQTVVAKHVYTLTSSTNSTYTVSDKADCTVTGSAITVSDTSFFVAGGTTYTYGTGAKVFNVDTDLAAADLGKTDTVSVGDYVVAITGTDGATYAVYIISEAE